MSKTQQLSAEGQKTIAVNRKAFHDYAIEDKIEAGLALTGSEIKSIRQGKVNLRDAYARVENGEAWVYNMHISPYEQSGKYFNHDPLRPRKLLLHRKEIASLAGKQQIRGYTLVPLRLYLKNGIAKIEIALAKGKREYDKRQAIAERDAQREIQAAMKHRVR